MTPPKSTCKQTGTLTTAMTAFMLGISTTAIAEDNTLIESDNNGMTLYVAASSNYDILAMNIRVAGPDNYLYESRIESPSYEWIPDQNLKDGLYTWEATVVTARPGAVNTEPPGFATRSDRFLVHDPIPDKNDHLFSEGSQPAGVVDYSAVPIERFFHAADKKRKTISGEVRLDQGGLETIHDGDPTALTPDPGIISRVASTILDLLVSSAHAQSGLYSNVIIESSASEGGPLIWRDTEQENNFNIRADDTRLRVFDYEAVTRPFSVYTGSPTSSLVVRGFSGTNVNVPRVGIGTAIPSTSLHITSGSGTRIRLETVNEGTSWRVGNSNESRLEISSWGAGYNCELNDIPVSCVSNAFSIETPTTQTQAANQDQAIYVTANGWVGFGLEPLYPAHFKSSAIAEGAMVSLGNVLGVGRDQTDYMYRTSNDDWYWETLLQPGEPLSRPFAISKSSGNDALVIGEGGNIGIGTQEPDQSLLVERDDGTARVEVRDSEPTASQQIMFQLSAEGNPQFRFSNSATNRVWNFRTQDYAECSTNNTCFVINKRNGPRFRFMQDGDMFIEGAYEQSSSRAVKSAISALSPDELLGKLQEIEVYEWSYNNNLESRHIGPMAEDFYSAFGLGSGDTSISPANLAGVSLAAARALHQRVSEAENLNLKMQRQNQQLLQQNLEMQDRLDKLESMLVDRM